MSRHGYTEADEMDPLDLGRWRAQVASAIRGKRGQALLRDLIVGLEAMPQHERKLHELVIDDGENACALGVVARVRGLDLQDLNPERDEDFGEYDADGVDHYWLADQLSDRLDIATQLAQEVMWENDENSGSPEYRWRCMYAWALENYKGQIDPFAPSPVAGLCSDLSDGTSRDHWRRNDLNLCTANDAVRAREGGAA